MNALGPAVALAAVAVVVAVVAARHAAPRFTLPGMTPKRSPAGAVTALGVAVLVAIVAVTAALASRTGRTQTAPAPTAKTMIVMDVSGSLSSGVYGPGLGRALRFAARDAGPTAGLVIFAENAVELLPPSAPATAVTRLARFVSVTSTAAEARLSEASDAPRTYETPTPWSDAFIGNTDISSGLTLAYHLLAHGTGQGHGDRIVLISDLQDGGTAARLRNTVRRVRRAGVAVVAVPVGSTPADVAHWRALAGAVERPHRLAHAVRADAEPGWSGEGSALLATCALAFAAVLGGLVLWTSPLRVPRKAAG
jgi:hypothetical protein